MKLFVVFALTILLASPVILNAQQSKKILNSSADTLSYCIGISIGNSLQNLGIKDINTDLVSHAISDMFSNKDLIFTNEQAEKILNNFMVALKSKEAVENLKTGNEWLAANGKKEGVLILPSGLQYKIINPGTGESPKESDKVTVHYKGTLIDGTQFDSSYDRGEPVTFQLNRVIKGWTEGLQLMKPGARYELYLPPQLGYGENTPPGSRIKPNSVLIFEVELISFEKQ